MKALGFLSNVKIPVSRAGTPRAADSKKPPDHMKKADSMALKAAFAVRSVATASGAGEEEGP